MVPALRFHNSRLWIYPAQGLQRGTTQGDAFGPQIWVVKFSMFVCLFVFLIEDIVQKSIFKDSLEKSKFLAILDRQSPSAHVQGQLELSGGCPSYTGAAFANLPQSPLLPFLSDLAHVTHSRNPLNPVGV